MSAKTNRTSFPGQHDGETVQLVFHQHPLVMRKQLIFGLLAILVGLIPLLITPSFEATYALIDASAQFAIAVAVGVAAYWFYTWVGWYYSVYIVTNERLVEIKQKGFFNRKVTEFGLDKVQNVNYHIKGFQAVIFQFGDIVAQTYVGDLVMSTIYRPVQIHQQLVEIVRRANSELGSGQPPPPRSS
jgi:uncharacterized membrane protein YdbT with pleckstrin-like domain